MKSPHCSAPDLASSGDLYIAYSKSLSVGYGSFAFTILSAYCLLKTPIAVKFCLSFKCILCLLENLTLKSYGYLQVRMPQTEALNFTSDVCLIPVPKPLGSKLLLYGIC